MSYDDTFESFSDFWYSKDAYEALRLKNILELLNQYPYSEGQGSRKSRKFYG